MISLVSFAKDIICRHTIGAATNVTYRNIMQRISIPYFHKNTFSKGRREGALVPEFLEKMLQFPKFLSFL